MKPSVSQAVSGRPISKEALTDWANREAQPLLQQLRKFANARGVEKQDGLTDGAGTFLQIWASDTLPADATWMLTATIAATSDAAAGARKAAYLLTAIASSVDGTVSLLAQSTLWDHETDAAFDARFAVSGRTVFLEVSDGAVAAMRFASVVDVTEARRS